MCLATIRKDKCKKRVGWKILEIDEDSKYWTGIGAARRRPVTTTYRADSNKLEISSFGNFTYPAGFHIFAYKKDAEKVLCDRMPFNYVVKEVRFRKVVAHGNVSWPYPTYTIVAKEIKLAEK